MWTPPQNIWTRVSLSACEVEKVKREIDTQYISDEQMFECFDSLSAVGK